MKGGTNMCWLIPLIAIAGCGSRRGCCRCRGCCCRRCW
nr:MAG TPA: hypothetical protein [Caudoviricetes sp.]